MVPLCPLTFLPQNAGQQAGYDLGMKAAYPARIDLCSFDT